MPDQFVVGSSASSQLASTPVALVDGWDTTYGNGVNNRQYLGDGLLNGHLSGVDARRVLTATFKSADGTLPATGNTITLRVPIGATVVAVHFYIPAGATATVTSCTWTLQDSEGSPSVLATLTVANPSLGVGTRTTVYFNCSDSNHATLNLVPGAGVPEIPNSHIAMEYMS